MVENTKLNMNKSNHLRKLLIVPILHAEEDMGSLASRLPAEDGYSFMVSKFWEEVRQRIKRYLNSFQRVKVYQDGLPDTQKKLIDKIVSEVKSPNYQLLRLLKDKGAKILGTEKPELLKKEYNFITQILAAQDEKTKDKIRQAYEAQAADLLAKRDTYIAKRIDETLKKGDLGILFIGASHQIKDKLSKNIQAEIL